MRERSVSAFLSGTILFLLAGMGVLWWHGRFGAHLFLNTFHSPLFDAWFPWVTHLADGITVTLVALGFLFSTWRAFLMVGLPAVLSALATQLLKRTAFDWVDRPVEFLDRMDGLRLVEGLTMHHHNSFPSGHATAAFSLCFSLAVILARPTRACMAVGVAALLGYSRIYLSQHFLEDVLVGAVVGTVCAWGVYRVLYAPGPSTAAWLDERPFRRRRA